MGKNWIQFRFVFDLDRKLNRWLLVSIFCFIVAQVFPNCEPFLGYYFGYEILLETFRIDLLFLGIMNLLYPIFVYGNYMNVRFFKYLNWLVVLYTIPWVVYSLVLVFWMPLFFSNFFWLLSMAIYIIVLMFKSLADADEVENPI